MIRDETWQLIKCVALMIILISHIAIINKLPGNDVIDLRFRAFMVIPLAACCTLFLQSLKKYLKS